MSRQRVRDDPASGGVAEVEVGGSHTSSAEHTESQDSGSGGGSGSSTADSGKFHTTFSEFLLGAKSSARCEVIVKPQASCQKAY